MSIQTVARPAYDDQTIDLLVAHLGIHKNGEGEFGRFASEWYTKIADSETPEEAWDNTLDCLNAGNALIEEVADKARIVIEHIAAAAEQTIANMTAVWDALGIGDEEGGGNR